MDHPSTTAYYSPEWYVGLVVADVFKGTIKEIRHMILKGNWSGMAEATTHLGIISHWHLWQCLCQWWHILDHHPIFSFSGSVTSSRENMIEKLLDKFFAVPSFVRRLYCTKQLLQLNFNTPALNLVTVVLSWILRNSQISYLPGKNNEINHSLFFQHIHWY